MPSLLVSLGLYKALPIKDDKKLYTLTTLLKQDLPLLEVADLDRVADIAEGLAVRIERHLYKLDFLGSKFGYFHEVEDEVALTGLDFVAAFGEDCDDVLGF